MPVSLFCCVELDVDVADGLKYLGHGMYPFMILVWLLVSY